MKRIVFLALVAALTANNSIHAQQKDPPKNVTNSIGMRFVWIPPGIFLMGSPKEEKNRKDNESQHKVTLTKGFYMGVYAVTQEEWQAVVGNNPSHFKGEKNLPVETVTWNDCQEFITKLREKDKKPYRLPTEAEWEYACRAGMTAPFHFGETISTDQANFDGRSNADFGYKNGEYRGKPSPVGMFPANPWGLHDMHGNVRQWCQDLYGDNPLNNAVDPQGPESVTLRKNPVSFKMEANRVVRGGAWILGPQQCRSAFRISRPIQLSLSDMGFRICFFGE